MKNLKKHFWHYLVYLVLFGGGFALILFNSGNIRLETLYLVLIGFLYCVWAMVHHYVHHELHLRVAFEYVLVVVLGLVLALFLFGV